MRRSPRGSRSDGDGSAGLQPSGVWRAPIAAAALLSLTWGVWLGLLRLGWILPLPWPDQLVLHGPLMIGGFLGTLVGLERAIGLAAPWAYAAPIASAAGALLLVLGPPGPAGPLLITSASAVVAVVFVVVIRRQPTLSAATMLVGAVAWVTGNALWAGGAAIYRIVFWWVAFLVLTIAGERLELNRLLRPTKRSQAAFVASVLVVFGGTAAVWWTPAAGVRAVGAGLLALTAWLAANDIARRTVRQRGVTRYVAVCMLSAYVWLGVAGLIAIVTGTFEPGLTHDALLHAVFLGFAVTMVFGHAPIVLPAVLRRPVPFHARFYAPYAVLQASVGLRLAGDLVESLARYRAWGGLFNAIALFLFLIAVASGIGRSFARHSP